MKTKKTRHVDEAARNQAFTFVEYLEFTSVVEFRKFKHMPLITTEEIESIDWQDLSQALLTAC